MRPHKTHARLLILVVLLLVLALFTAGCSKGEYVGSSITKTYHDSSCVWAEQLDGDRAVWFETAQDADDADYSPCSSCLPDGPPPPE